MLKRLGKGTYRVEILLQFYSLFVYSSYKTVTKKLARLIFIFTL